MKKLFIGLPLGLILMSSQPVYSSEMGTENMAMNAKESSDSISEITRVVKNYYDGMYYGDEGKLTSVFYKDAMVIGYLNGKEEYQTLQQWIGKIKSAPVPASRGDTYDYRISSFDITEKVAVVKVNDTYLDEHFVDYLTLMKKDQNWVILGKVFYHFTKAENDKSKVSR